jgi:agmatine deiminase
MVWPARRDRWERNRVSLDDVRLEVAQVAKTIARFEPVTMVARPDQADQARTACGKGVDILPLPVDDIWIRDTGPTFLLDGKGGLAGVTWRFNAWGGKELDYAADEALGRLILEAVRVPCFASEFTTEGGAIQTDGEGTLLTTKTAILNRNRNPGVTQGEAEATLCGWLGVREVVWLPGSKADEVTDGHVDGIAAFARPGLAIAEVTPGRHDPEFNELQENLRALRGATDANGRRLEVVVVQRPTGLRPRFNNDFCASYVNFYLANGAVVMPKFGEEGVRTSRHGMSSPRRSLSER